MREARQKEQKTKGPTFWDKEWKRSKLDGLGKNTGNIFKGIGPFFKKDIPGFFKNQERKYKERQGKSLVK